MQRHDVLVIGPLGPLVPHPVRVRLGLLAAGVATGLGLLLVATLTIAWQAGSLPMQLSGSLAQIQQQARGGETTDGVQVQVMSEPTGATILVGGREDGHTPAAVSITPGEIVTLRRDGFLDAFVRPTRPSINVPLWRAQPGMQLLRPPVPGASIIAADFLPDGRVALAVEVPPTGERQPWAYDPAGARLQRLGHADTPATLPTAVAIAPDGVHTVTILRLDGLDGAAADQLTLEGPEGTRQPLSSAATGERLLDVTWSPAADAVLLLSEMRVTGGQRFHLRLVGIKGDVRNLADLPGEPVAGSWVWAADGHAVAFLVHTSGTALVAMDMTSGELRYVDDLRADAVPSSGAVAPATWAASGDMLYAAPLSGGFPGAANSSSGPVLFDVAPGRVDPHRIGDIQPVWAPIVRTDGVLLTLARGENDVLVLRPVDPSGHALAEQRLGVQVSGAYAARWDLEHQQLIIVRGGSGHGVDVLLLQFGQPTITPRQDTGTPLPSSSPNDGTSEVLP